MGYLFGGNTGETSESLAEARQRMAMAMMQQGMDASPIRSPWQGAARLAEAVMGGLDLHQMQMQQNQANDELSAALSGQAYTPQPTPGLFSGLFGSGGPKVPASGVQSEVAASAPSSGGQPAAAPNLDGNQVYSGFMDTVKGGVNNPYALAAIASTGKAESGFSPGNASRTWNDGANNAGGIMSWNGPRLAALQKFAGGGNGTPQQQAQFFLQENPQLITALNGAKSVEEAQHLMNNAWAFKGYNEPGNANAAHRLAVAQSFLPQFAQAGAQASAPAAPTQVASLDPGAGIPAPAAAGEMGATSPAPYHDPMVTTAYRQPQAPSPAAAAINQQAPIPQQQPPMDPQQTASIGPDQSAMPPMQPPVNVGANSVPPQGPLPSPEAAQIPSPQPQGQQGDGATRLAQAVQSAPAGFQQQGNPLANPKAQALVHVMMNPYASSSAKSLAAGLLQQQMAPQIDYMTRPDGSVIGINKLTGESRMVTGPMKTDSIIEGPVDPQTGYATKLIWNPIDGVTGRIGLNGEKLPPGQFAGAGQQPQAAGGQGGQDQGAPTGPPPGVNAKTYFERRGNIAAENSMPTPKGELDFGNGVREQQSYKEYSMALPTWNSFTQHITDNSPASDKAIVDDFAKILNPGRAVTTGAFQLNMDAQSVPANIQAQILKAFNGDGELGPDARAQMARVAEMKMQAYQQAWGVDSKQATDIATHYGYEPTRVVPQLEDMQPIDYSKINSVKTTAQGQGVAAPAPAAAADVPSGSPTATNANGDVIQWNGTAWVPVPRAGDPNSNMNRVPTGN